MLREFHHLCLLLPHKGLKDQDLSIISDASGMAVGLPLALGDLQELETALETF